jgi:glycosyltransferase involved in cell wall biosynthesis
MNIGIVTTWYERGASYVSRQYMEALENQGHSVFIFARGGKYAKNDSKWDLPNVKWGYRLNEREISTRQLVNWIDKNNIELVLFNEQDYYKIIVDLKERREQLIVGTYVDYYRESDLNWFNTYDFLICNTQRHMEAMEFHPSSYYIRWGTDTELFSPKSKTIFKDELVFFHSAGLSNRKGTDLLIEAFIDYKVFEKARLIIHTQQDLSRLFKKDYSNLEEYNIKVINKTVTSPGLYNEGDVYVYPTKLDGLGLTMYESLSCGLPVIATNYPPMNEIINDSNGSLVKVKKNYARSDGYYWPLSEVDKKDLAEKMNCFINIFENDGLSELQNNVRNQAIEKFDWKKNSLELTYILENVEAKKIPEDLANEIKAFYRKEKFKWVKQLLKSSRIISLCINQFRS